MFSLLQIVTIFQFTIAILCNDSTHKKQEKVYRSSLRGVGLRPVGFRLGEPAARRGLRPRGLYEPEALRGSFEESSPILEKYFHLQGISRLTP